MKNKFQSKSVPRGTRTIWRYLGALFILFTFAIGNVWAYTYNHATSVPEWTVNFNTWSAEDDAATKTEATVHNPRLFWNSTKWDQLSAAQDVAFDADGFYYIYQPGTARQLPTGSALSALSYVVAKAQGSYFKYNNTSSTATSPVSTINGLTTNNSQTTDVAYEFHMPRAGYVRLLIGTDSNGDPTGTANDAWKNVTLSGATTGNVAVTYHASGSTYDVKTKTGATTFSKVTYTSAGKKMRSVEFALNSGTTTMTTNPAKLSNNSGTARKMFIYAVEVYLESDCTKPGTPTSLAAGSVTHNSASLSWTAGANNDGHKIYIEKKSDKTKVLDWTDATSPYAASGLDPETTYTFKVKAKGATGYCDLGDEASADFATEVDPSATTYKVTLVPAGGTISDATGWTLNAGNYEKEVSSGTELALPTFTKANRTFKTWRKAGPTDVTSPITVTADVTLTAVWNATVEQVIYSWEGAEGGATEVGGTAQSSTNGGSSFDNAQINVAQAGYYCIQLNGKNDYSTNIVEITLSGSEKVKAGDKIRYTGFYNNAETRNAAPKMRASDATAIFTGSNLPNINSASPRTDTHTVPEGINTATVQLTRAQTQSSSFLTKLQIIRPTLVEEANIRTVTFNYNDGGATASTTVEVASGSKVSAPADPTRAHYRFHEWQLSGVAYDFATAVTADITLVADWTQLYTVTYAKGEESATGDAPTQDELAAGEKFTVAANTFAYEGHDFSTWNDGSADVAPGAKYTMGAANVTLTAQWITATTKVTVTYKDGETTLGSEEITINTGNPVGYATYQTRNLATFDGWYNDPDLAEGHKIADISALTASANVNVYGKWNYQYASSVNIEQWILTNGAGKGATTKTSALIAQLGTNKFASNLSWVNGDLELDSLSTKSGRNEPYLGLKVKVGGKMLDFRLAKDSYVKVKFGEIKSTLPQVSINGGEYENMVITEKVWSYTATGNDYISIKTADANAVVFKQIMINEDIAAVTLPWRVTYNANGGTCATAEAVWSGSALILPDVTPEVPADYTFAGWYDEVSGGSLIGAAGASYTPTDNTTLFAHFAPVEYAVNYSGGEGATGTMTAGAAGWGTMVTPDANAFEKTGHVFSGWEITKTSDGSATGITFSEGKFEMPKYDVTLVAQWEDNSKVAVIVETNVKYESLADAIDAADTENVQTIQLLQNINQANGVAIAKSLILDLNGNTYTCTSGSNVNSRAIKITAGDVTIKNGSIIAVPTANFEGGCYGPIRIEGASTNVTLEDLTLQNGRHYGLGIKLVEGALRMEDCTVISQNGGGGLEVGEATADVINCTFTQTGLDNAHAWISTCLATCDNGVLNVQGGTYTSEHYSMYVYTSGGEMNVESGSFTGDMVNQVTLSSYPDAVGAINISGGSFEGVGEEPIHFTTDNTGKTTIAISGGTFDAPVENQYCAPGYVPAPADPVTGKYTVEPKDGVEIIGVVVTGNTTGTVTGLYKGTATVNLNSKKIDSGKYIYVTLKDGYTFEENDVLIVDVNTKSNIGTSALEITTGVGNIDGAVWKTLASDEYSTGDNSITLEGIAAGQTSIGLKRSDNQNAKINGLRVLRPMKPILTAITINDVACEKGEGNTYTITLPEEGTDLAALTVVPTIIRNAPHATTPEAVISNEGAWKEGANTYRVMDKDGDYTDYTITITLQGEAPAPVITTQPAGVAYCAGSEPTLEVVATGDELHYAWFKEAGETDEAVGSDQATYTVASAGTYYVIVTNHVDTKLDKSVTSENAVVTLNTAAAITTQPTNKRDVVAGSEVTLSVVATNATGYQWYSCDDAEKHNAVAITGAEAANYVFTCNANGFYYCVVGNACGDDITSNVVSVKLEPEGCNLISGTLPTEAPYIYDNNEWTLYAVTSAGKLDGSSRFKAAKDFDGNDVNAIEYGRIGMTFAKDVESLTIYATATSTGRTFNSIQVTSDDITTGTPSYSAVTADLAITTTENTKQYILTADNMLLETGKKYWLQFSGTLTIFKICYSEALAMPKLPTLADQELCAGAAYETFDATITNAAACEGTVSYKWYETTDTENPVAETATFTPSAEGTYYVVVTHSAAGHITRTVQSDELSVAHFDALSLVSYSDDVYQHMGTEATLSVVATGKNVAYVWYTCSNAAGDDAVAITPAETESSLTIASIAEGVQYYKVVISHDCDATTLSHVFTVEGWNQLEQVDVTATTTWDMTNVSASAINLKNDFNPSKQNERLLLANIDGVNNNASFNSQALMFEGQHIGRTESDGVKHLAGRYVQFNVTVPGAVFVTFASNGDNARTVSVNGKKCTRTSSSSSTYETYAVAVEPGSVEIVGYQGTSANQYVRISKIEFKAEDNYHRTVNPSFLGTLCWTNNAVLGGATLYAFAGKNENNYLVFDEVEENRLEAGKPYIFMPENGNTEIKVYNTDDEPALTEADLEPVNNMYGTVEGKTLVPGQDDNMYYFSSNHIWAVKDFVVNINVPAYYCYVDYAAVLAAEPAPAPAPGRRRVSMGVNGKGTATGIDAINASEKPMKLIIDGQMFILRGQKMFDATGRLVK